MASEAQISILVKLKDEATQALGKLGGSLQDMQSKMQPAIGASQAFGVGLLAAGAAAGAFAYKAVQAAADAQSAMARVDATLKTMGKTGIEARDKIIALAGATTKLGFDDEAAAESITKFYQRTKDLTQAQKLNTIAMDLARAKHIDLSQAADMVNMVLSGNGRALKAYGIEISDTLSPLQALGQLHDMVAGQAEAFGQTYEGQMAALKVNFGNLMETIGEQLLPVLTQLVAAANVFVTQTLPEWIARVQEVVGWLKEHQIVLYAIAGAILGALMPAIISMATTFLTVMIPAFVAAAVALAPWMIGGAIIAAIVAGVVWIVKNWEMVKAKAIEIWGAIKEFLAQHIDFILLIFTGGIGNLVKLVIDNWGKIRDTTKEIWEGIGTIVSGVWEGIKNTVKSGINWVIEKLNGFIDKANSAMSAVTGVVGIKNAPSIPRIPMLANGGIVNKPTLAMIGEAGPEAVVPLSRMGQYAGAGGITINLMGPVNTGPEYARELGRELALEIKRQIRL